ncbi:MAG TPA: hypothetical protein VGJ41_14170 [Nocardioides sp.]|jgi:hypothetical protein
MATKGRRPKGQRTQVSGRLPSAHVEIYMREAARMDLPLTDYMALKLAEIHGLDVPDYIPAEQERLRRLRREREAQEGQMALSA